VLLLGIGSARAGVVAAALVPASSDPLDFPTAEPAARAPAPKTSYCCTASAAARA
jgi:hypothetical protein